MSLREGGGLSICYWNLFLQVKNLLLQVSGVLTLFDGFQKLPGVEFLHEFKMTRVWVNSSFFNVSGLDLFWVKFLCTGEALKLDLSILEALRFEKNIFGILLKQQKKTKGQRIPKFEPKKEFLCNK